MPAQTKPTFVIVPGAWHGPEGYAATMAELQKHGYGTIALLLPSVGADPPLPSFDADVARIRSTIIPLVAKGQSVIVMTHSYGGIPTSEALRGLERGGEAAGSKGGGVVRLVYLASFLLPEGQHLQGPLNDEPMPWYDVQGPIVWPANSAEVFYHDVPEPQRSMWVSMLRPHSLATFYSKLTYCAWRVIPTTYIYCTEDKALFYPVQQALVAGAGVEIQTERIEASHSPFLSRPGELATVMRRIAGEGV